MITQKYPATVPPRVCNNMNVIDPGNGMFCGVNNFNNSLSASQKLNINIINKVLKQNEGMVGLALMYPFNHTAGYWGTQTVTILIFTIVKMLPASPIHLNYKDITGKKSVNLFRVTVPENRHHFRKIKPNVIKDLTIPEKDGEKDQA